MRIQDIIHEVPKVGRKHRSPKHPFHVRHLPWQVTPFAIAPVVPGETLQNALLQVRAITDPIRNPLIGWWLEHYLFFVKLSDIEDAGFEEEGFFKGMLIDPAKDLTSGNYWSTAPEAGTYGYTYAGCYDFVTPCLQTVVKSYFRDEDENAGAPAFDGAPLARAIMPGRENWMESLQKDDTEVNPGVLTGASPDDPTVAAVYQEAYDRMCMMGATTLTYEDWLKSFGIRGVQTRRPGRPELIRYSRAWQYPSSHVSASTGAVNSVVSWGVDERADKKRFIKEPGFIFGVTVARPKVYLSNQLGNASGMLDNAFAWLPATLRDRPELGLKKFAATAGPLQGKTGGDGYWVDVRDLFMHGDQFTNVDLAATDAGFVALPVGTSKASRLYASEASMEGLFASTATTGIREGRQIKQDGALDLHFLTAESDPT